MAFTLELRSDSADLQFHCGLALNAQGRAPEAAKAFKKTIELDPNHAEAKERLVEASYRSGDKEAARAMAEALVANNTAGPVAHFYLGLMRMEGNQAELAIPDLEIAVQKMPGFPPPYQSLGEALLRAQKYPEKASWLLDQAKTNAVALSQDLQARLTEFSQKK